MLQTRRGLVYAYIRQAGNVVARLSGAQSHSALRLRRGSCRGGTDISNDHGTILSANLSIEEMRALVRRSADPLKSFGEAYRVELKSMRGAV